MDGSVLVLGDLHFTGRAESPWSALWREGGGIPRLLAAAGRIARNFDVSLAIQVGDLVDGDFANEAEYEGSLGAAWNAVKRALTSTPLVAVPGNHDVASPEGAFAWDLSIPSRIARELSRPILQTNFAIPFGDDALICIDSPHPDETVVALPKLLAETAGCRRTIVVLHHPVLPVYYGLSYRSILFGDPSLDDMRLDALSRLAKRGAIILCGHVHTCGFADWFGAGGRIVQIHLSSLWDGKEPGLRQTHDSPDEYGRFYELAGCAEAAAFFAEFRPGLAAYRHFEGAGFAMLESSSRGVFVSFHAGDPSSPACRIGIDD